MFEPARAKYVPLRSKVKFFTYMKVKTDKSVIPKQLLEDGGSACLALSNPKSGRVPQPHLIRTLLLGRGIDGPEVLQLPQIPEFDNSVLGSGSQVVTVVIGSTSRGKGVIA